jgi:diacylglycerol kinase family enzyme
VSFRRGRRIEADAAPGAVLLELDGEPVGALPAQIELLPGALSVIGPLS